VAKANADLINLIGMAKAMPFQNYGKIEFFRSL